MTWGKLQYDMITFAHMQMYAGRHEETAQACFSKYAQRRELQMQLVFRYWIDNGRNSRN